MRRSKVHPSLMSVADLQKEVRRLRVRMSWQLLFAIVISISITASVILTRPLDAEEEDGVIETLRVKEIQLINADGELMRVMGALPNGVIDGFYDTRGNKRLSVGVVDGTASVLVMSADGGTRAVMLSGPDPAVPSNPTGYTSIGLQDTSTQAGWAVRQTSGAGLIEFMKDESGTIRTAALVDANGDFRFHVQKSALEEVGEILSWASTVRSLTR